MLLDLRFFLPDWEDRVHKEYDFISEKPILKEGNQNNYSYIWDIYGAKDVPIDGLLISRANLLTPNGYPNKRGSAFLEDGIRKYYNYPNNFPLMCDCGAFSYIMKKEPPYDPIETLEFYAKCEFDFGVSVDHLIVPATFDQKEERYRITLENAKIMFDEWNSNTNYKKQFKLIGVVQGWDVKSYCKMTKDILNIGYDYIAIGGVARSPNKEIIPIIKGIRSTINKITNRQINIHVFGVGREGLFRTYLENGITSFDTASYLRSAWLSDKRGYHYDIDYYTPIRVKLKKNSLDEEIILNKLRAYSKKKKQSEKNINLILKKMKDFEEITEGKKRNEDYERTLKSKCWQNCCCKICKNIDIEVIIFRGNNRNRRRGFHNIWNFYNKKFIKYLPKISVLYQISDLRKDLVEAIPEKIWNQIKDMPIEVFVRHNEKVLHISDGINKIANSRLISQLERSRWVFSNIRISHDNYIFFNENDNLKELIGEKVQEIYKRLTEPEILMKFEGETNIQSSLEIFY